MRGYNKNQVLGGIWILSQYLQYICQISLGKQIFGYNEGNLGKYLLWKYQQRNKQNTDQASYAVERKIDSRELMEMNMIPFSNLPKVTVSYRSSFSPSNKMSS